MYLAHLDTCFSVYGDNEVLGMVLGILRWSWEVCSKLTYSDNICNRIYGEFRTSITPVSAFIWINLSGADAPRTNDLITDTFALV